MEGYTFAGWGEVDATVPAGDVTYEGSYIPNNYTVTFKIGDEVIYAESLPYGAEITAPEAPEMEGYTFKEWAGLPEVMPAQDIVVEGIFEANNYTVTFKIGDWVIYCPSLPYGTEIPVPEAPEMEGYTFAGWGEVDATVPASDVTYEGSYTVNTYIVYYYVGEELVHTAEVAYGEAIPEYIYEPTIGWVGDTYETMPPHDVVYIADIATNITPSILNLQRSTIYDLTGRRVKRAEKGIYIVGGKKMLF